MTNREKYITKRDEYDLMMTIAENIQELGTFCPITAVGGKRPPCKCKPDTQSSLILRDCETCCQDWLNEKGEGQ
jgi:hypothetical protein